jgi:hypothetical protein
MTELVTEYKTAYLRVHGYSPVFFPKELTIEWLADQLHALSWYAGYQQAVTKQKATEQPKKATVSKSKPTKHNPFK